MNNETILKLAQECDGWSILDPEKLIAMGAGRKFIESMTAVFESDLSQGSTTIFVEGKPVNQLRGVRALDLLWWLAEQIDANTTEAATKRGRGSQATELKIAISQALAAKSKLPIKATIYAGPKIDVSDLLFDPAFKDVEVVRCDSVLEALSDAAKT